MHRKHLNNIQFINDKMYKTILLYFASCHNIIKIYTLLLNVLNRISSKQTSRQHLLKYSSSSYSNMQINPGMLGILTFLFPLFLYRIPISSSRSDESIVNRQVRFMQGNTVMLFHAFGSALDVYMRPFQSMELWNYITMSNIKVGIWMAVRIIDCWPPKCGP